jgi:benzoyl-CoA reductase/2-hydroxyglutaryl-CoA dehydratase subunit BcrC/BadD/HgdB
MNSQPKQLTLDQWQPRYDDLCRAGLQERFYGGPLQRHFEAGDRRLGRLRFDNSPAALGLWNLVLSEDDRLRLRQEHGSKIIGTMKDLGTTPIIAYAFDNLAAFYPDAAWWIPCFKQQQDGLFDLADRYGLDASFCPVRAMVGAFVNGHHFPLPDALVCGLGATCDDFAIAAARLESLGYDIFWWEMPHRRRPENDEPAVPLPNGQTAPHTQFAQVRNELKRLADHLETIAGQPLKQERLAAILQKTNRIRRCLQTLQSHVFTAPRCPLPALEMMLAEMLAIHFCSDPDETERVLTDLLAEVCRRLQNNMAVLPADAVRVYWVNPPADVAAMNLLEQCGGRLCGADFMSPHALRPIDPCDAPFDGLAKAVLSDPMIGPARQRAETILHQIKTVGAEAVVLCRIPGASHCATEGLLIADFIRKHTDCPVVDIEIPTLIDPYEASLRTRLDALMETARIRRRQT